MSVPAPGHEHSPPYTEVSPSSSTLSQLALCALASGSEPRSSLVDKLSASDIEERDPRAARAVARNIQQSLSSKAPPTTHTHTHTYGRHMGRHTRPVPSGIGEVLYKFLAARNMNAAAAKEMLIATLRWRDEMDIPPIVQEQFPADVFDPVGTFGRDKEGRPVSYILYGNFRDPKAVLGDSKRLMRLDVQFRERIIAC